MSDIDDLLDNEHARLHGEQIKHRDGSTTRRRRVEAARLELADLREEVATARELLIDVYDLWDDNAIENSTPENYTRAREVFDRILEVLPPEKRDAILGKRAP